MTCISGMFWKNMVQEQVALGISLVQVTTMWLLRKNWLFFTKKMQPLSSPHALWLMIPPSLLWQKCFQVITEIHRTDTVLFSIISFVDLKIQLKNT